MTIRALIPQLAPKSSTVKHMLPIFLLILILSFVTHKGVAQTQPEVRIAVQLDAIKLAERLRLPDSQQGHLWASLARSSQNQGDLSLAEHAYGRALHLFAKDPAAEQNYAATLDNLGSLYLEEVQPSEAEAVRKKALAIQVKIGDPIAISRTEEHLAEVALTQHKFKDAEKRSRAAFDHLSAAGVASGYPDRSAEISALVSMTYAEGMQTRPLDALATAEKAEKLAIETFVPDSTERGHVALALGFAQWKNGATADADRNMSEGIRILRLRLGERNPIVLGAMYQYRDYLNALHRGAELASVEKQIAERLPRQASQCGGCVVSVFALQ